MSYHNRIMNIPHGRVGDSDGMKMYRLGHRDARHAAAEIATEADIEIERLRDQLGALQISYDRLKASEAAASQEDFNRRNEMDEMGDEIINLFRENASLKSREEMWEEIARNLEERLGAAQKSLTETNEEVVYWFRKHRNLRNSISTIISDDAREEISNG